MSISYILAYGRCDYCRKGMYSHCTTGGWMQGNSIDGTQAEYVRIGSIPTRTDDQKARVGKPRTTETAKIAPLSVFLACDAAQDVSGQIFAVRADALFLLSQNRPLRSMHRSDGWKAEAIGTHVLSVSRADFYRIERSQDVFSRNPL